jgi:hypothetical protein
LLKSGAAPTGLLAAGSLSGCSSIPFIGGAGYTEWIPAPGEFQESEQLLVASTDPATIVENEDNFDEDTYDSTTEDIEALDIDYEDLTTQVVAAAGFSVALQVYDGDYDESTVVDALEDGDTGEGEFGEEGEYEGYTVYLDQADDAPDDPETAFGVDGTLVVQTSSTEDLDAEEMLELAIDTKNGDGTRFVDDNEDFSTVTDEVGDGTSLRASVREDPPEEPDPESGSFEGQVGEGRSVTINGETADLKYVVLYEDEGDADEGDLEDYFDAEDGLDEEYSANGDPSYNVGGRVGTIEFSFDTDEL